MNIKGLDKARILKALYNASTFIAPMAEKLGHTRGDMTLEDAEHFVNTCKILKFDYVYGRCIKVDISGDEVDLRLYDRDMGEGAGERALREEFKSELEAPAQS